jgi:Zn-dependent oligopeptidase
VWGELAARHSSVPHAPGTRPEARFSHLTVYSASYYSYTYARCLSAAVWRKYLAQVRARAAQGRVPALRSARRRPASGPAQRLSTLAR